VLELEDRRGQFDANRRSWRAMDRLPTRKHSHQDDLRWLGRVRLRPAHATDEAFDLAHCGEKVHALISEYIAERIVQLLEPVSIFSERFDEEVAKLGTSARRRPVMEHDPLELAAIRG
jgi:hypothetical protein